MGKGGKRHLKTLAIPRSWPIERKNFVWTTKPKCGMHWLEYSMPLVTIMRMLGKAKNRREAVKIIKNGEIRIDEKVRKDPKFGIGFMDIISIPRTEEHLRVVFNEKGYITLLPTAEKEAGFKLCLIDNKKSAGDKFQYLLHDGRNFLADGKYKVGDVLKISLPGQKVLEHFAFEEGNHAYIIEGKHIGKVGKIKDIRKGTMSRPTMVSLEVENETIDIPARCCFVVGKEKVEIKLR